MTQTLHATRALAGRVDGTEIGFCTLAGGSAVASLEAGGGRALYVAPGSPFNKVLGLGLAGPVPDADLDQIEAFYAEHESPVQIELCPLAEANIAPRLCARGFVIQAFENELARRGPAAPAGSHGLAETDGQGSGIRDRGSLDSAVRVSPTTTAREDDLWIRITATGFTVPDFYGRDVTIDSVAVDAISRIMGQFRHPAIKRYLAWVGDEPAAGIATFLHDGVLGIFGAATHPRFRRRGVQTALVAHATQDLSDPVDLMIATTEPGSTSQRTFERFGFQVLYTRAIFVKPSD